MAEPLPSVRWYAKPTYWYAKDSDEAFNNAAMIYIALYSLGWTLNAIAGVLGNIQHEGGMNPWAWQDNDILASTDTYLIDNSSEHGYGLVGFTPSGHYLHSQYAQSYSTFSPNYSDIGGTPNDGDAQIRYIAEHYVDEYQGWINRNSSYYIPWADYKTSTADPSYLAGVWMYSFEGPRDPTGELPKRQTDATYYYNLLLPYDPNPPSFVPRLNTDGMAGSPWWYSNGNWFYANGYGLDVNNGNCTCYAYGRYAEIRNEFANLPIRSAKYWYDEATAFERGQEPRLGAIICYGSNLADKDGHVAVVEEINGTQITTSNSGWGGPYFWTATVDAANGYLEPWMSQDGRDYFCQGFIYNDYYIPPTPPTPTRLKSMPLWMMLRKRF